MSVLIDIKKIQIVCVCVYVYVCVRESCVFCMQCFIAFLGELLKLLFSIFLTKILYAAHHTGGGGWGGSGLNLSMVFI